VERFLEKTAVRYVKWLLVRQEAGKPIPAPKGLNNELIHIV